MIETLYKTKTPESSPWSEHFFELSLGEQTVDGQFGYFVRETHCWRDAKTKQMVRVQYTLSPRGGFAILEEAQQKYQLQKLARAKRGFIHCFAPRYEKTAKCRYVRIETAKVGQESSG
ncbi:MAG TPA: hypothetical protein VFO39_18445 [Candidatus Sulfotelmatobacter sp.]|nr:hypothetical protein [Candidatus Sulfotelmatobacter sp.]